MLLEKIETLVWGLPLVILLIGTHIFFTIYLKFPQKNTIKGLKLIFKDRGNSKKGISSFESLMTILAATLGVGNIVGVATAITIGGIGSIFWIFVSGVFAIATKYAETFLVLKYRKKDKSGYYGGAMYVLKEKLNYKILAFIFAVFVILETLGSSMIQSNSMVSSVTSIFPINIKVIALLTTVLCAYIILGNEKRIARVSSFLVPLSSIIYISMCIYLAYIFRYNLIPSIFIIVKEALNFKAVGGGIAGIVAIKAMNLGLSKGLFSNEAGMGTSPIFNATVEGENEKEESMIAASSVFIDTVLLCVITGILMVASGLWKVTQDPMDLSISTFSMLKYGDYLITFCIAIFALATLPCIGYYLSIGVKYISNSNKSAQFIFKCIYIISVYIGCIMKTKSVWEIASIANALMIIPNLIMIYKLKKDIE